MKHFCFLILYIFLSLSLGLNEAFADEALLKQHISVGFTAYEQGDYSEATKQFKEALKEAKKFGETDPRYADSLNALALIYSGQGRYTEAEPLFIRALKINEKVFGPNHPIMSNTLMALAMNYRKQGRFAEAEPLNQRALAIREKAFGSEHPEVANALNDLGLIYLAQRRYGEAEPLFQRALAIREKALGPEHQDVGFSLGNLAKLYEAQGSYKEAESLYQRCLLILEKALGSEHPDVARILIDLAKIYGDVGRMREEEPLIKRALTIFEKSYGPEHPEVAQALNDLGAIYFQQFRDEEAEPLFKRALVIRETILGPHHPSVAQSLHNLALFYRVQNNNEEAELFTKRALKIVEKVFGPDDPIVANTLMILATNYSNQRRDGEAELLYKRILEIHEKAFGSEHPEIAQDLIGVGYLYLRQKRYEEAESVFNRSLSIIEKYHGAKSKELKFSLTALSLVNYASGQFESALHFIRRGSEIIKNSIFNSVENRSNWNLTEEFNERAHVNFHIHLLFKISDIRSSKIENFLVEGFEIFQLATKSDTAQALSRMAARFASGEDALAKLIRQRQDTLASWQELDKNLVKAASKLPNQRNMENEQQMRKLMDKVSNQIKALDATLTQRFPEYLELASPRSLKVEDAQKLLRKDEALMNFLVGKGESYLWVLRKDKVAMHRIELGAEALNKIVQQLRRSLDPADIETLKDIQLFAVKEAHELYQHLFSQAAPLLKDIKHLIVVPDGALQSLPFGVLVTEPYEKELKSLKDHRDVPWLAKKYAITVLPSVSSLRALRAFAKGAVGDAPFVGFGDPVLGGDGGARGINVAALFSRGAIANVDEVRQLPSLPETADELVALAKILKSDKKHIYLKQQATETQVKSMDLKPYRTIAFATHGLMAGEFKGLAEPALVFTPPAQGTAEDDGLLTASEVAQLKLNADWVLLSACNTAAADGTPGAEGLSGLAKAFFYAGTRSLLVSHWAVSSDATVELTTHMFDEYAKHPEKGKSEALRQSMLALMNNDEKPYYAHPMFWAPFVVVGEGSRLH